MMSLPNNESHHDPGRRAFTLIEIFVALTIVAVIAAVAIPTMKGLDREEKAAAPVRALAEMVQTVRQRAMRERRPYQIVFEPEGIHACPFSFPQSKRDDFLRHLKELRTPPKETEVAKLDAVHTEIAQDEFAAASAPGTPKPESGSAGAPEPPGPRFEMPWTQSIVLEPETECSVLFWGDGEWDSIEGDEIRRWVFQPTGMASPAQIRLVLGSAEFEAGFDPLTGELRSERTRRRTTEL
jgi:prepilin-type N-terminal cleavage/methylation domain-containing protein